MGLKKALGRFTLEEVKKHNTEDDCWVIIDNKVYNVTTWLPKHPGGGHMILNLGGRDCTDEFKIFHLEPNFKRLKMWHIGDVVPEEVKQQSALAQDIDDIVKDLREKGAFESDPYLYLRCGFIIVSLFLAGLFCLSHTDSKLWITAGGVCIGMFWQQLAFIGHDLGHHVVTHSAKKDNLISIFVGNFLQGISLEWWKDNHNTHHVVTNSIVYDPDIQHLPFMAVSKEFFKSLRSKYYERVMKFDAAARFFIQYQHFMFYPIMSLARFNLYAQSFIFNIVGRGSRKNTQKQELLSLLGFWCWLSLVLSYLGGFWNIWLFMLVSHATAGLVHVQICINHFSMETYQGIPQSSYKSDGYIKSQLATTTNIDCPPMLDLLQGGLQFQIEHHLFPHVTRSHFRYVQQKMKELCRKHSLPYFSKSFWRANWDVLCHLKETASQSQFSDMFWDGINANG